METSSNGYYLSDIDEDNDEPSTGWRRNVPRALGILAFLAVLVFWAYVFSNRDSIPHPDEFADVPLAMAAEGICSARQANIAALPLATVARSPLERSKLVDLGTDQLELMVAELAELTPTDPQAVTSFPLWLDDYRLYISDRQVWTAKLAAGEDEAFLLSANAQGGRVTDLLATYADVNEMASCAPSSDA